MALSCMRSFATPVSSLSSGWRPKGSGFLSRRVDKPHQSVGYFLVDNPESIRPCPVWPGCSMAAWDEIWKRLVYPAERGKELSLVVCTERERERGLKQKFSSILASASAFNGLFQLVSEDPELGKHRQQRVRQPMASSKRKRSVVFFLLA